MKDQLQLHWIGLATLIRKEVKRMLRVVVQTIGAPLVSATLYIFIFGFIVGSKIDTIAGVKYITFVFPGILMLNIISSAFSHTSSSVFIGKYFKTIEELLITPFSYIEMVLGFALSGVVRALIVAAGILTIGLIFGAVTLYSLPLFLLYVVAVSFIFSFLGMLAGLWAKSFEQFSMLATFVITPFTYLGGIFYSIGMLPPLAQDLTRINPFFYFIDGIRHSMVGISEANTALGLVVIGGLVFGLGALVTYLFATGWRIRS